MKKKKNLSLSFTFSFTNIKHTHTLSVSTPHVIVQKPQSIKNYIHLQTGTLLTNMHKNCEKQKHFLYASDSWQGARYRTNDRSVLNFPQAHSLRLSGKYFPSYHTHNWPEGVSLNLDIQRILCFDKITV